jgi:hypothetical protein
MAVNGESWRNGVEMKYIKAISVSEKWLMAAAMWHNEMKA